MTPLAPLAAGLVLLGAAAAILRSYGPRYRVARLLATIPSTPLATVLEAAEAGESRYVRIDGRIDSEEAFEDAARRPLVFRRTRLQARNRGRWVTFEDGREQVPFEVGDGLQAIAIHADALDAGLVVIRRESTGTVGDLADRAPADLDRTRPARALVEQVSAVEQAVALGVPERAADGSLHLTAGFGRPLILTTLEVPEAMRVIGGGSRVRPGLVAAFTVLGGALVAIAAVWVVVGALTGTAA